MIEILNQFILPKFVNYTTSFKKLHSIIYSGALTIIRLNGSKKIDQTNNIKAKELPKWERRLNKRINNIRRDLGRITQYLKGINSNHLNNCIQSILNKNRIHCLKYNEYNETLIEIKDTLLQKLNIYSKRLKSRAGPIPILSIGYRPILQAFRYVPIPKNFQILLSEKYLNLIEQAASRKAPTLVFQENWLDNNLLTCYTYSGVFSGVWNLDACWLILIL
jgi:hypothetical protein